MKDFAACKTFIKNRMERYDDWYGEGYSINIKRLMLIRDMAKEGIIPDGSFSDNEVVLWELFRYN